MGGQGALPERVGSSEGLGLTEPCSGTILGAQFAATAVGEGRLRSASFAAAALALEGEGANVVLGPDNDELLGLQALHDESLRKNALQLKDSFYALKHRAPGSKWPNEDVEPALTCVVAINFGERVPLRKGLDQTLFDRDKALVVFRSGERQLHDELKRAHVVPCEA